jgi:hypothetical protein
VGGGARQQGREALGVAGSHLVGLGGGWAHLVRGRALEHGWRELSV